MVGAGGINTMLITDNLCGEDCSAQVRKRATRLDVFL